MSCKFKKFHPKRTAECPYCEVTDGECQFISNLYDDVCSIREAYHGEPLLSSVKQPVQETKEEKKTIKSKLKKFFKK